MSLSNQKPGEVFEGMYAGVAPQRVHDGASYLRQGDAYPVARLDVQNCIALLRPVCAGHITDTTEITEIRMLTPLCEKAIGDT